LIAAVRRMNVGSTWEFRASAHEKKKKMSEAFSKTKSVTSRSHPFCLSYFLCPSFTGKNYQTWVTLRRPSLPNLTRSGWFVVCPPSLHSFQWADSLFSLSLVGEEERWRLSVFLAASLCWTHQAHSRTHRRSGSILPLFFFSFFFRSVLCIYQEHSSFSLSLSLSSSITVMASWRLFLIQRGNAFLMPSHVAIAKCAARAANRNLVNHILQSLLNRPLLVLFLPLLFTKHI
jgi:hypothetical protein